jgi:hypothetical protein
MPDRESIEEREKEASEKLEKNLQKGGKDGDEKPRGPEEAKKKHEKKEDPY